MSFNPAIMASTGGFILDRVTGYIDEMDDHRPSKIKAHKLQVRRRNLVLATLF